MARLCLRLMNDDGSFREFKKERIKAFWVKEALKHNKEISALEKKGDAVATLEARLKFTCAVFEDKDLTPEAILDGLESHELFNTLDKIYSTVLGVEAEEDGTGKQ